MGILAWIIMGGLAGWIASIIMKKNASMGVLANILVGIVGAFIGGLLMSLVGGLCQGGADKNLDQKSEVNVRVFL